MTSVIVGVALCVAVAAASAVTSYSLRGFEYRDVSPEWQPRGRAFSIWSVIFLSSIAMASECAIAPPRRDEVLACVSQCIVYIMCAIWGVVFSRRKFGIACITLITAFAISLASLIRTDNYRPLTLASSSLLTGWLGVAACLSVAIARPQATTEPLLVFAAILYAFVHIRYGRLVLLMPLLWATIFIRSSVYTHLSSCTLLVVAVFKLVNYVHDKKILHL